MKEWSRHVHDPPKGEMRPTSLPGHFNPLGPGRFRPWPAELGENVGFDYCCNA